jgi:hypothetical protein
MNCSTRGCLAISLVLPGFGWAQQSAPPQEPMARFGTTVVKSAGLKGDIYELPPGTGELPNFKKLVPVGSIYTNILNVPPRPFLEGFPGVTNRLEWFAIDYNGRFWIEQPGRYRFSLLSDDGSKLFIDGHMVIDNDGVHAAVEKEKSLNLKRGIHRIRISYFQGPGYYVALVLKFAGQAEDWRVFNMDEVMPPLDNP